MKPPKSRKAELAANATGGKKSHAEAKCARAEGVGLPECEARAAKRSQEAASAEFKMTELGLIPVDWEVKRLGEICSEYAYGTGAESVDYDGKNKYIRITDIDEDSHLYSPSTLVSPSFFSEGHIVKDNDLLVARTGASVGKTYFYSKRDGKLIFAGFLMKANVKHAEGKFIFYWTLTDYYKRWVLSESARSGQPGINIRQLQSLLLPLPPLAEQRRIAGALSDVDELISALGKLIEKKRNIKTGAMQELLTGKTRLPGFGNPETQSLCASVLKKDTEFEDLDFNTETQRHEVTEFKMTELGPMPKDWEVKRLGEIGESIRGVSFGPEQSSLTLMPNATMLLRANNIQNNQIVCQDVVYVVNECIADSQQLEKGDILICAANGSRNLVGKAAAWRRAEAATFGAFMAVFRCAQSVDSCFVEHLLLSRSYRRQLDDILTGSAINNLNARDIEGLAFAFPALAEQQAIAAVLSDIDAEIAALEADRAKYERIKSGMMQELLTGKTRLEA